MRTRQASQTQQIRQTTAPIGTQAPSTQQAKRPDSFEQPTASVGPFARDPRERAAQAETLFRKTGNWPPAAPGTIVAANLVPRGTSTVADTLYFRVEANGLTSLPPASPEVLETRRRTGEAGGFTPIFAEDNSDDDDATEPADNDDASWWDRIVDWFTSGTEESSGEAGENPGGGAGTEPGSVEGGANGTGPASPPGGVSIPGLPGRFGVSGTTPTGPEIPTGTPTGGAWNPPGGMATWTFTIPGT